MLEDNFDFSFFTNRCKIYFALHARPEIVKNWNFLVRLCLALQQDGATGPRAVSLDTKFEHYYHQSPPVPIRRHLQKTNEQI